MERTDHEHGLVVLGIGTELVDDCVSDQGTGFARPAPNEFAERLAVVRAQKCVGSTQAVTVATR